ncbi:MAG TPA: hypothetical protein VEY94_08605, partial [Patescibacteria group bacterium]|nr:hypothetical protein [Patescibacteria group bacterium]
MSDPKFHQQLGDTSHRDIRTAGTWNPSTGLTDPATGLPIPVLAAAATALLYELAAAQPRLYPCALLAPLPILAVAP